MLRWVKQHGRKAALPAEGRATLAVFGKHPGWDDHMPDIGVVTETLATLKQSIYVVGIGGQINSGAWERLEPEKRIEGFDHMFLWVKQRDAVVGELWSSADRKGRSKYPMGVCIHLENLPLESITETPRLLLDQVRDGCRATSSADQVMLGYRAAQDQLDQWLAMVSASSARAGVSTEQKRRFLEDPAFQPDSLGLLRVLHELDNATGRSHLRSTDPITATKLRSYQIRVPACAPSADQALLLWATFLRCALPDTVPLLLVTRHGTDWLDLIIGNPTGDSLFCLQAPLKALPLATAIPYDIAPELGTRLQTLTAQFLRSGVNAPASAPSIVAAAHSHSAQQADLLESHSGRGSRGSPIPIVIGVSGLLLLCLALGLWFWPGPARVAVEENPEKGRDPAALKEARAAILQHNYAEAIRVLQQPAQSASHSADEANYLQFAQAMDAGERLLREHHGAEAMTQAGKALAARPGDPLAIELQGRAKAAAVADTALNSQTQDPRATKLKADAQAAQGYQAAWTAAQAAFSQKDYAEAIRQADLVLDIRNQDPGATKLKADAQAAQGFQTAWKAAQAAFSQKDYAEAIRQADLVLSIRNQDPGAMKLKADAQAAQGYQAAWTAAQAAFSQKDYTEAIRQADLVLGIRNQDPGATKLKADAQAAQGYQTAWKAAQAAFGQKDYTEAIRQADTVLSFRNQDPAATKLKADAQAAQGYQTAWTAAQAAFGQKDYTEAIRQAETVLSVRSQDPAATKLKADAQAAQAYHAARNAAQAAFDQKNYAEAIRQADVALGIRNQDAQAGKIKGAAQLEQSYQSELKAAHAAFLRSDYSDAIRRSEAALQQKKAETEPVEIIEAAKRQIAKSDNEKELQQKYLDGLAAGRAALERRDYAKAIEQADGVLALKAKDPEASKLKLAAQQEQGYQAATAAFNQGDYGKALGQCQPFKGTDRFDQLTQQIGKEQSQLGAMQKALGEGNYAVILTGPLPGKAAFDTIKASASEENRALQQATQKLTAGDYGFIDNLEQQSYRAKPPFATLLETGRKERDLLTGLQSSRAANDRDGVREKVANLSPNVRRKEPFAGLEQWAGRGGSNSAQAPATNATPSSAASGNTAHLESVLRALEIRFGIKEADLTIRDRDGNPVVRETNLSNAKRIEASAKVRYLKEYRNDGWLSDDRKARLQKLDDAIRNWKE